MIHWNAELRKQLQREDKSRFVIFCKMFSLEEMYSAATVQEFLTDKSYLLPPASSLMGELLKGQFVNIQFPSLKYDRISGLDAKLSDPTGEIGVTLEYLWENSWISPESVPNGGRLFNPIVAYSPKQDKAALIYYDNPVCPATKGREISDMFHRFSQVEFPTS